MHHQEVEEAHILDCNWSEAGGQLEYDLHYLHPDWGLLIQSYEVISQNYEGQLIYGSEFTLHKYQQAADSSFSRYPKPLKAYLWKIIFAVKRKFFEEVKPAVVTHFIKQTHSGIQRYHLYAKHLDLPNYDIELVNPHTFIYLRKLSTERQEITKAVSPHEPLLIG
jgi:hypothetical protein